MSHIRDPGASRRPCQARAVRACGIQCITSGRADDADGRTDGLPFPLEVGGAPCKIRFSAQLCVPCRRRRRSSLLARKPEFGCTMFVPALAPNARFPSTSLYDSFPPPLLPCAPILASADETKLIEGSAAAIEEVYFRRAMEEQTRIRLSDEKGREVRHCKEGTAEG